ncbi:uncharacterized protein LOC116266066 [Nymphaea colorata]|uniref:uncharacterized protein LOC116266066 n=1 Tax=Nymphaea colorata TaxID=210225 RepID=UPI00214F2DD5|nr:uncharacterized protein LOC116266066 [Nymphaea colorata]
MNTNRNGLLKLSISCNFLPVSDEKNCPLSMDGVEGASCHETTSLRKHITKAHLSLLRDNQLFISSLGLGLSLFCIHRCSYWEPLAAAIKASYGGLKECFVGVESGALLKRELETIGLIVKTGYLTSELSRTRKVVLDEEGGKCAFLSARCTSNNRLCRDFFCLHITKTDYDVSCGRLLDRHQIFFLNCGVVKDAKAVESCISDILCLSIPVDQEIRTNHCYRNMNMT